MLLILKSPKKSYCFFMELEDLLIFFATQLEKFKNWNIIKSTSSSALSML